MATTRANKVSTSDLQYAEEVMEVYRLGDSPLSRQASPSMRRLYEWCQNPENYDTFIKTTVKTATEILAKHRQPEEAGFIIAPEKKGISELEEFLRQSVAESQSKAQHEPAQRHPQTWVNKQRPATVDPSLLAGFQSPNQVSESDSGGGNSDGTDQQEPSGPAG